MHEVNDRFHEGNLPPGDGGELDDGDFEALHLGENVRIVLAAVGGGAIRIGREIARRHLRFLETVAINCDPHVVAFDEFDRRVCLGPETGVDGDTGGSTTVGGALAQAARPALDRIFEGATFVVVLGTLGGGAGTGALPYVLEAAARQSEVLSAFVVRPFLCEGDRRALADRLLARLHFVEPLVEKQLRGAAKIQILDNQQLATHAGLMPFNHVNRHWSEVVAAHIEQAIILPAEAMLHAAHVAHLASAPPMNIPHPIVGETVDELPTPVAAPTVEPLVPVPTPSSLPGAAHVEPGALLTFEVRPPTAPSREIV